MQEFVSKCCPVTHGAGFDKLIIEEELAYKAYFKHETIFKE